MKKEDIKEYNRKFVGLKSRIKNACKVDGLRVVQLRYEWLKNNSATPLPVKELDYNATLTAYKLALEEFIESYKNE